MTFVMLVDLEVKDFRDLIFRFTINDDRRLRGRDSVWEVIGVDGSSMKTWKMGCIACILSGSWRVKDTEPT